MYNHAKFQDDSTNSRTPLTPDEGTWRNYKGRYRTGFRTVKTVQSHVGLVDTIDWTKFLCIAKPLSISQSTVLSTIDHVKRLPWAVFGCTLDLIRFPSFNKQHCVPIIGQTRLTSRPRKPTQDLHNVNQLQVVLMLADINVITRLKKK